MQIGEAEPLRPVDENCVDRRNVDATLDDRRCDQNVRLSAMKTTHHAFQFTIFHLTVREDDPCFRNDAADRVRHGCDRLHEVVNEVHLPVTIHLAEHGVADQRAIERSHLRGDRPAIDGRRLKRADVTNAQKRQVQRTRDRRGCQGQNVDRLAHRTQTLFVLDTKALLLVDDHQAQACEGDVLAQQPMGANDDVDLPTFDLFDEDLLLGRTAKP